MPIHCGAHWTCAVIDIKAKALFYYDSLRVRLWHKHISVQQTQMKANAAH